MDVSTHATMGQASSPVASGELEKKETIMSTTRTVVLAMALTAGAAWPALADCAADLTAIDQAMGTATLSAEQKTQADELKKSASDNCTAGKAEEAAAPIGELKKILGLT
jgi:hypothetical protein